MKARRPDRCLMANVVRILREVYSPVPGRTLALLLDVPRLRSIGEAVKELRYEGFPVTYQHGKGYMYTRSRAGRKACAATMRQTARSLLAAASALERGHVPQARIPATRTRRAA